MLSAVVESDSQSPQVRHLYVKDDGPSTKTRTIPVIDISNFWRPDSTQSDRAAVVSNVRKACQEIGFLIVSGHTVPSDVIRSALDAAHRFYDLPQEKKLKYMAEKDIALFTGYVGGRGLPKYKGGPIKETGESKDSGTQRGEKALAKDGDLRETYRINRYPRGLPANIFPSEEDCPGFRDAFVAYYKEMEKLSRILLSMLALAMGLPEDYFVPYFAHHASNLMSAKYFRTSDVRGAKRKGAHTDAGIFTVLLQDDTEAYCAGGLQVKTVDDHWIEVPVLAGTFVCNIGDLLMRWTNDMLLSSFHQVVNQNMDMDRHSLIFFQQPNPETVIECLETCKGTTGPRYPPVVSHDYFMEKMTKTYL
mmetsp:Transcript_15157/g.24948  ORF Transcript_15157/g.24948 Transcript_15157/m.24948 type:complete len:362 (-) Transcript_15157:92-1177(-)|eukprot:CAMPEP_0184659594 /NCGR_PEP_ID=MMETSP0308-20130426/30276_1 /TAXON_ID=38269 /ORGANISM="Gloeochaete witrockiana, Strain SAG 46.84" /LENGTH=361 /DNA_ID=CAMNT_0027099533 /DNA_START=75 /DNA_END=1160 /DNA_ORIENTATION=+